MRWAILLATLAAAVTFSLSSAQALTSIPYPCWGAPGCFHALIKVDGATCAPGACQWIVRPYSGPSWVVGNAGVSTYGAPCATLLDVTGFTCNNPPVTFSGNSWTAHFDGITAQFTTWARKSCGNGLYRFSSTKGFNQDSTTYAYPTWQAINITSACR